mmetsp:Transcript_5326/g.13202  ORF Transcript_5326/g.13202 Transcript_5326/m.13202 type:complete len:193 (-) Transcript_5326:12-590(-)
MLNHGPPEDGYQVRYLSLDDFNKGYLPLLEQLTVVGNLSEQRFTEVFKQRELQPDAYRTLVIEHVPSQQLVATGTLLVEAKFVREGTNVGHIEDIVVDSAHRGRGLAKRLMSALGEEAQATQCRKVILDCAERNIGFYEKCGYKAFERQMRLDLPCSARDGGGPCDTAAPTKRSSADTGTEAAQESIKRCKA